MPHYPRLIRESPNVENTLPLRLFQAQHPARISQLDGDKLVLYAGRAGCQIQIDNSVTKDERLGDMSGPVSVFVLNTSLILWITQANVGLDIPYTSVILHAIRELEDEPVLYLQLLSSELLTSGAVSEHVQTVEMIIRAGTENADGSGLLGTPSSMEQMYQALSTCSAFHVDSESGSEDEFEFGPDHQWITADGPDADMEVSVGWANSGDADDLGMDLGSDGDGEAGAVVDVGETPLTGRRRGSDTGSSSSKQRRRG